MSIGSMNNLSLATAKPVNTGSRKATPSKPSGQATAKSGFGTELSRVHDAPTREPVPRDGRDQARDQAQDQRQPDKKSAAPLSAPTAKPATKTAPLFGKQNLDIKAKPFAPVEAAEAELEAAPDLDAALLSDVEATDDAPQAAAMELDPRFANVQFAMPTAPKLAAKLPALGAVQAATVVAPKVATANPGIEFLQKMKQSLNVSGEEVVTAFAQLSDEDLAQAPAASVDKIVAGLGLNDQQSVLAKQFFNNLIEKTKTQNLGEDVKTPTKPAALDFMSKIDLPRPSQNFFKSNELPRAIGAQPEVGAQPETDVEADDEAPLTKDFGQALPEEGAAVATPLAAPAPTPTQASAPNPAMQKAVTQMRAADDAPISDRAIEKLVNSITNPVKAKAASFAAAAGQAAPTATATTATGPSAPTLSPQTLNGMISKMRDQEASSDDQGEPSDEAQVPLNALATEGQVSKETKSSGDFQTQLIANAAKPNAPVTIPELMQNAKILIKDGGGEMKVTMHPEGMGEVALKVTVENGKVNVAMLTQTEEVKHLIERQLGELKQSISSTHLQAGEFKVDTASQTGKPLDQQFQDGPRQQAQANLEQYRQDTQSGRRGYNNSESRYGRASTGVPSVGASMMTAGAPRPSDSSRRLNLVA